MKHKILLIAILMIASFVVKAQDYPLNVEKTGTDANYNYFRATIVTDDHEYPNGGHMNGEVWFLQSSDPLTSAVFLGFGWYYFDFKVPSTVNGEIRAEFSDSQNGISAGGSVYLE